MNYAQAIDILERSIALIDTGVYHEGAFSSMVRYTQAKGLRKEYRAAVRFLKKTRPGDGES